MGLQLVGMAVGHDQTVCSFMEVSVFVLRPSLEDTELVVLAVVVDAMAVFPDVAVWPTVTVSVVGA